MLTIDVISDLICPWWFIGKRRLEKALAGRSATVRWHPFQLIPDMPREGIERREYRIRKFGSWERSQQLDAQVAEAGRSEGLAFNFDRQTRTPNTLDAHRVFWLAGEKGVQDAVVEALFFAYFTDGKDLSDRSTLAEVAAGAGLDRADVDELLAGDAGLEVVRAGEEHARRLGVSGVPFFIVKARSHCPGPAAGVVPAGVRAGGWAKGLWAAMRASWTASGGVEGGGRHPSAIRTNARYIALEGGK